MARLATLNCYRKYHPKIFSVARKIGIVGILCFGLSNNIYAVSHLTLMSHTLTPKPAEINIINALDHTTLPLKKPLNELYQLRDYKLIWSDGTQYQENAKQLFQSIQQANKFGLNPYDYDAELIQSFLEATSIDKDLLSKSDIVFSHAYIKFVSHIYKGKLNNPHKLFDQNSQLLNQLNNAANNNTIIEAIDNFQPKHGPYINLIQALNHYKELDVSHETIKLTERSYEIGDHSEEIPKIRQRLHTLGDLDESDLTSDVYDENLMLGVSHFQVRHGLEPDGVLGKRTIRELNIPIWERIQQLELNLARVRSLPDISVGKHLLVNIPAYKLYLYDNQQLTYKTNVVVGKKKHKTPTVSSQITKIILSPYWHVPRSITKNEIIPKLQQDPHYLVKNNMRLISTSPQLSRFIDPYSIDWTSIDPNNINFRIRQEPGNKNSLGNIKFIFPNRHSVYLHDTPSRGLFAQSQRAFSHGCIRLEDPFGLAETLLSSTGWSKYDLLDMSKKSKSKTLPLEQPIPIHLTYMTAWADDRGIINFRPDIYRRDSHVLANLYNAAL